MSEPVRVAVAVEGPTDAIVLEAILSATVPGGEFVLQTLQPEVSARLRQDGCRDGPESIVGVVRRSPKVAAPRPALPC